MFDGLSGYVKVSESQPEKSIESLPNGDTVTTYTTTVTYHKIANTEKQSIINVDEDGNILSDLEGYFKIKESEIVKTSKSFLMVIRLPRSLQQLPIIKSKILKNMSQKMLMNTEKRYLTSQDMKKSQNYSQQKTVETLPNGDIVTTYTTIVTFKKTSSKDPIIDSIKSANDPDIKEIENQVVNNDTRVSIEQADKLVNINLSKEVRGG
ncbi:hypothetical protein [Enterococcus sp. AZ196]|uniref:hypothetical protein n=1 Tax=Enterococcus sp. AZ196 TaxID=2774659 RepID=UPI003D2A7652